MSKKKTEAPEPRWGQTFDNIPRGLRAGKAIKTAKEAEAAVEALLNREVKGGKK